MDLCIIVALTWCSKSSWSAPRYQVRYGTGSETFSEDTEVLLRKRAALTGEVTATLRDIGHFEHEVARITGEVEEAGEGCPHSHYVLWGVVGAFH